MFRLSIRSLLAKKLRLLTTALAIVLGVAFTTGTMILADTMTASISTAIDDVSAGIDTVVQGRPVGTDEVFTLRAPVPLTDLDRVRTVDGVADAVPYWEGYTQVVGRDGKALDLLQSVGLNWIDDPALGMFRLVEGRAPARTGEVVLGGAAAEEAGVGVGDPVDVITAAGRETVTVTGLAQLEDVPGVASSAFTFFRDADAEQRLGDPGTSDWLLAKSDGSVDDDELTARIAAELPDLHVVTGAERAAEQKSDLGDAIGVLETILLVFGAIALFVGSFTIANTFAITVAQRTREFALVRAVGASRAQVLLTVMIEATIVGTFAAAVGLAGGLGVAEGLTALFERFGLDFPAGSLVVQSSTVVTAFATGVLVTVGAALVPARRAARVAPVEAMRNVAVEAPTASRRRVALGTVLAAAGLAAIAGGVADGSAALVGLGSLAAFHASIALGPVLVRPVARLLALPMRRFGASGRIAAANAVRNPKRSAATAAALTIGVMLVAGASMFAATAGASIRGDAADVITADRVVRPVGANPGLPTEIGAAVAAVPGSASLPVRVLTARVDGEMEAVAGVDLHAADGLLRLDVIEGSFSAGPSAVVADDVATRRGWAPGDVIDVGFGDGHVERLPIGAVVEQNNVVPSVVVGYDLAAAHDDGLDGIVLVAGDDAVIAAVESSLADAPTAVLDTVDDYAAALAGALDTLLSLVLGLLGLAVLIAVLGIATTIGLSVHERTRELGVLRAVGMSRRQLRRSIRLEAIVIALFGTTVGLAMGLGFTAAVISTLGDDGFGGPILPLPTLLAIVVGALLAGTVAAALPARSAARRNVLDAIAAD